MMKLFKWTVIAAIAGAIISVGYHNLAIKPQPCKNLGKVKDIDDLLFQFYSNIDSQCLFEMSPAELERIWGIPVFDYSLDTMMHHPEANDSVMDVHQKGNTIYVKKVEDPMHEGRMAYEVAVSMAYRKHHHNSYGSHLEKGLLPKYLPNYHFKGKMNIFRKKPSDYNQNREYYDALFKNAKVYQGDHYYVWRNSYGSRRMPSLRIETSFTPKVNHIEFINRIEDDWLGRLLREFI